VEDKDLDSDSVPFWFCAVWTKYASNLLFHYGDWVTCLRT